MAEESPRFRAIQLAFAAHLRDPATCPPPPGLDPLRMAAYRQLFLNNIEHFIGSGFPVLKSILDPGDWSDLIHNFYAQHRCRTPLFIEIAAEFLDYLQNERGLQPGDPPFLHELAHYEWVELALSVDQAEPPSLQDGGDVDWLEAVVSRSPLAWPLAYRFPVHRIGPEFQPGTAPESGTYLVVYRNREDVVRFLEVNQVTYRLLEWLDESSAQPLRQTFLRIAQELQHPEPDQVLAYGKELVGQLHAKGVVSVRR